jgi:hypothetical protein
MYKYTLFIVLSITFLFSGYSVGDTMSPEDQNMEFGFCYPDTLVDSNFSFAQHNGDLNGGNYQVLMIEVSASW